MVLCVNNELKMGKACTPPALTTVAFVASTRNRPYVRCGHEAGREHCPWLHTHCCNGAA